MRIESNKCFKLRGIKPLLDNKYFKKLNKYFNKVTFKKPKNGKLIKENKFYKYYIYNKKITIYITPYHLFKYCNNFLYMRTQKIVLRKPKFINYYSSIQLLIIETILTSIGHVNTFLWESIKINSSWVVNTIDKIPIEIINHYQTQEKIWKHFATILNFIEKDYSRKYKGNKNRGTKKTNYYYFNYNIARYRRNKFSGFKGLFTSNELRAEILNKANIITDYSWKALLDSIREPVIYQSKLKNRNNLINKKFYYYTMEHYYDLKALLGRISNKENKKINNMLKKLGD